MRHFYWERHPGGPFATLIAVATTYLHPEANEPEALRRRARRAGEGDEEMRVRDWIPAGAEGVVLDTKPDGRCLVDLTLVTPAEDDMGVYGTGFGDGDYGEGRGPGG